MPTTQIIETAMSQWVAELREELAELRGAEQRVFTLGKSYEEAQQAARAMQMNVGARLLRIRDQLPKRGTPTYGWGAFLSAVEIDDTTAWRYMQYAERAGAYISREKDKDPTAPLRMPAYSEVELDKREGAEQPDAPPPTDADAPAELLDQDATPVEPEVEIDRDTWCTPVAITDAMGKVDLDPCANERSHVQATTEFNLENDEDGIELATGVPPEWLVFLNPPYSNVRPWIDAYAHTRFVFLLKFDPSTRWFEALISQCELVLFPRGTRVEFEPPEGVPPEKSIANPFPHALFFARAKDAPKALRDLCYSWPVV